MSNFNTAIRYDASAHKNAELIDLSHPYGDKDNAEFFAEVARRLRQTRPAKRGRGPSFEGGGVGCIVLLGEYGLPAYRMRRAQEVIRVDRTPSLWSHALLLLEPLASDAETNRDPERSALVIESTLTPNPRYDHFSLRSGVSCGRLADYAAATFSLSAVHCAPNVAVIAIALNAEERSALLERAKNPESDQLGYDLLGQLGTWFSYVVSRGTMLNPLAQGVGMSNASFVQLAYDAAGVSLSPGAQQRNTAPEHIWQAARYLHETFRLLDAEGTNQPRPVSGYFCARERACVMAPVELELPRTLDELIAQQQTTSPNPDKPPRTRPRRK